MYFGRVRDEAASQITLRRAERNTANASFRGLLTALLSIVQAREDYKNNTMDIIVNVFKLFEQGCLIAVSKQLAELARLITKFASFTTGLEIKDPTL